MAPSKQKRFIVFPHRLRLLSEERRSGWGLCFQTRSSRSQLSSAWAPRHPDFILSQIPTPGFWESWHWPDPASLRGVYPGFFRLESMAPWALCAFCFLRNGSIPSGSEAFKTTCVSLHPLQVREVSILKFGRPIHLRHHCILAATMVFCF